MVPPRRSDAWCLQERDFPLVWSAAGRFTEQMLDFYERTGHAYDDWANGVHRRAALRLAEIAAPAAGDAWLDIGCGTGLVARAVERGQAATRAVAVDISLALLEIAGEQANGSLALARMDAHSLGFPARSFDVVTLGQALAYMADPDAVLAEAFRVLRRGGRIAVSCQRRRLDTPAQRIFFSHLRLMAAVHPIRLPRLSADRAVFGEPRVIREMLGDAGFEEVRTTQLVVGQRARDAHDYTTLMMGAGPQIHALVSVLGPRPRRDFEARLDEMMAELGDGAYRYHHAFTFAVGRRP